MKKWLILTAFVVITLPTFGASVGKAVENSAKMSARVSYRASKNVVMLPYRALKPVAKYLYRAGDGSPIPTCIPGHPCDDKDELRKS